LSYLDVPARHTLCLLLFFGYFMAFMLRINLNVAIVIMVKPSNATSAGDPGHASSSLCGGPAADLVPSVAPNTTISPFSTTLAPTISSTFDAANESTENVIRINRRHKKTY